MSIKRKRDLPPRRKPETIELEGIQNLHGKEADVVQINKDQLAQIEYLLDQSAHGLHFLFDHKVVKKVLANPTENMDFFTFENINRIQDLLSDFLEKKTFSEKQKFLEKLDGETYELLLRSYFNIVDNTVFEATKLKH